MKRCPYCLNPQAEPLSSKTPSREKLERTLTLLKQEAEALEQKLHENLLRQHRIESTLSEDP